MNLITGATGLLGSHIAEQLHSRGERTRALVRRGSDTSFLDGLGVEKVFGDLSDRAALEKAVQGVTRVYHSAAKVGDWGHWDEFQKITIDGTRNLLTAASAAGVERFLHISSISVYGYVDGEGVVLDETAPLGTNLYRWSYYSKAKVIAENMVWDWHREKKIKATVVRPSWLYGPRDRASIGRLIGAIRTQRAKIIGDGENRLSLSYAGNVAEGAILAATKPEALGQAYNCCSDGQITLSGYMNAIAKTLNAPAVEKKVPYQVAKTVGFLMEVFGRMTGRKEPPMISRYAVWLMGRRILFSNEKIRSLGWTPTINYETGIPMTVKWYLETTK
ncbi:MAG: NAD-dependent epimerase/dehydratase family protein [Phycisphaerae bacterium]